MARVGAASLRIEGTDTSIQYQGLVWKIGWSSVALLVALVAVAAAIPPRPEGFLYDLSAASVTGAVFGPPLLLLLAVGTWIFRLRHAGAVAVEGDCLVIGDRTRIPLSELSEGWFHADSANVEIHRRGGAVIRIHVPNLADGERILAALGLDAAQRTLRMSLGETDFLDCISVLVGAPFACGIMSYLSRAAHVGPVPTIVLFVALAALVFRGMREVFGPARMTVGADGIVVERLFRARFYPHQRIADLEIGRQEVQIVFTDGSRVVAKGRHVSDDQRRTLHARFEEARRVASGVGVSDAALSQLDRRGQSGAAWRAALQATLEKTAVYRGRSLTREDLLAVVESPSAPGNRRIGAALALVGAGAPEDRARIRVAALACADARVRVALESAADDALDDAALEEASAEEAEASAARR